jgi:crotonobetainyl-CoA:carnitine CoA-transferase CaiB-like acyl-CoA transferase
MMADFGAEVIKVEPPEGDENRRMHELPGLPDSDIPYSFLLDNRSKQAIALDLKDPDGLAVLHRLVAGADVFLTNFRAAARRRLRITYEDLAALNPRLVYASASGFGDAGPEADKPAYDTVVYWARSGLESSLMSADGALGRIPPGSGDHPSGVALFGAVMLALFARERTAPAPTFPPRSSPTAPGATPPASRRGCAGPVSIPKFRASARSASRACTTGRGTGEP